MEPVSILQAGLNANAPMVSTLDPMDGLVRIPFKDSVTPCSDKANASILPTGWCPSRHAVVLLCPSVSLKVGEYRANNVP